MPKLLSCAETEEAVLDRTKTETRRLGWWEDKNGRRLLLPGDRLTLVRKAMGRKRKDGTVEPLVRLAEVEVLSVHREPLSAVNDEAVKAEGVDPTKWEPYLLGGRRADWHAWALWFAATMGCEVGDDVTVIRWRYVTPEGDDVSCEDWCLARCQGPCQGLPWGSTPLVAIRVPDPTREGEA